MADPKLNEQLLELQEQVNQLKPTDNSQEAILLRRKLKQIQAQIDVQDTTETQELDEVVVTAEAKGDVKTALDGAKQYKEDIKKITPETEKTKIGYEYFGLKMYDTLKPQIERETYYPDLPGGRKSGFIQYKNTYDEDLKKSLGNKKYEEWKKIEAAANKDGVRLDETNINKYLNLADFDEQTKSEVVQQSKSKKSDLILRDYSNKERNIIEKEIFEGEAKEKAYEEYSNTFNKNLEKYKKTGIPQFEQPDYTPIVKELNEEVKESSKNLDTKFDNFKTKQEEYNNTYKDYEKRITEAEEKIKNFSMPENPTVAEIQERNALAEEYNNIFKEDLFTGLDNQWQELKALGTEITNESEKLNKASLEVGDINLMSNSLSKNYNRMDRFLHTMEESFLGSAAMLGSSILKGGGDVAAFFTSSNKYDARTADWYQDLVDMKGHAVDYNNRLQKYRQNVLPEKLEYGDGGGFDYFAEMMIDNSPSILTAFGTMGYSSLATGAGIARATAVRQATNAATGVFFTMEGGGQMANLEISQREAPKMIAALKNELKNETNLVKRKELEEQISDQENLLNMSQFKKSFNSIAYGGIASLAERFGTLRFINDFQKYSKPLGLTKLEKLGVAKSVARVTSKAFGTTSGVGIGMGIELVEEGATLLGQNFMDIVVLDQNKSLIEGLDGEFVRNTLATSLGISGPSASMNLMSAFNNEVKLRSEARQEGKIRDEVIDIQNELNILDKRTKKARDLKKRQNKLLAEAAEINSFIPLKLGNMTDAEVQSVFENGKRMRELMAEGKELGQQLGITSYEKQRVEDIKKEIQTLFDVNQETLGKSQKQYLNEIGKDVPNAFEYVVNRERYDGYKHLIRNMKGINLFATDGKNIDRFLEQSNYTDQQKEDIKNAYNDRSNAVNINDDVITFDDNVGASLSILSGTKAAMTAVSPLHEVGHIQTRKAGIIKDGKLAAHAEGMVEDIIADVRRRNNIGKLSDSDFQIFNDRINEYKSKNGEVNADELIQLVSDFSAAGILPKSSFEQLYSAKTFINSLLTKFNGEASPFFKINTANDAFDFITSWQQKALTSQTEGAEEETDVVESKDLQSKIASLVPNTVQTQQDFFNRDVFNPIYNNGNLHPLIARYIRSKSTSQEQAELNIQNVADRLLNFNPEATRKDGATVGAQGFVEFINSNANFAKLDSSKQLAIEAEQRKRTEKIDDAAKKIAAPVETKKVKEKPTYKSISKSNIFSTSAIDQIKNKLVSTVRVLKSKINAPTTINQTVKPIISEIKTEMGKQADIIIKKDAGGLQNKRLEKVFLKSKKATLENAPTTWLAKAMPFAVQKSVGGKYTGEFVIDPTTNKKVKVFEPNFINDWQGKKIDRVKTLGTGQTSGNQFVKRKPNVAQKVTDEQYMAYMFKFDNDGNATEIIRGRKESWSKMMAEEVSFELIDDALNDLKSPIAKELIKNQTRLGVEIVENFAQQVRKDIDRGTVKESKGLASFTPEQMDIYTSSKGWADFKNKMAAAKGKYKENTIYRFHKESFLETYSDKLQKEIAKQFFVKLKNYGDVESIRVQLKEDNSSLPEYLEAIRNQIDFNETVRQITGAEASIPVLNDNKVYVADTQQYVIDQAKGEDIRTVVAFFAPTFANSGKIGRERKGVIGKVSRADLFYNQAHVISSLNEAGFNIDKITKKNIILKDGTVLPREFTSTAKVEQKHLDGSLDINKEIEIAGKAWDFMMKLIKNLKNQPPHVQALTLAAMNSGTNTVLRVAAPVLNVSTVLSSKTPSDYRYEHRPPARTVMALSYKSQVLGDKNINIEALKNDYVVSIIPVTMDKVIGKMGFGQSTVPDYKPGITPATNDYYNAFTKNKPGIVSIKNLKTGEIIGKDYEASSKLKNQPTVKEAVAQPKQPKEAIVKESKGFDLNKEINNMIARQKGVRAEATYSEIVARKKGASKGALQFFLPATAEDFRGLTSYTFAGKGKQGEADQKFFEDNLVKPYIKGVAAMERARQALKNDYRGLLQMYPEVKKSLNKEIGKTGFTLDQAIRAYLYEKSGNEVPGVSKRDLKLLTDTINNNENYKGFADGLLIASKKDSWAKPDPYWDAGSILKDLNDIDQNVNRAEYLQEFIENVDIIFNKQNLNKIEALYGSRHREALQDIIRRMKSGSNRPPGTGDRQTTAWLNWVNNSVGTIMFFNRRSALLQMLSFANFTNWSDNNPLMAAKAFANQPTYWKAWVEIFNSDKLKQRRGGLKSDVQEQEIANQAKNSPNKVQAAISYLLKIGFTPTQIADSVAIATGGATFLINRTNTYQKQGMSYEDARAKAFEDFSAISDETQQSGDPMLISKQQAGHLGRFILSFQNTPMQYTRLMKKAGQDLINGRGDWKTNVSKILYYGFIQNLIFAGLQNALFALLPEFDPEEEEEAYDKQKNTKYNRIINSMIDTILRGSGLAGAIVSTLKNTIRRYNFEDKKGFTADHAYTLLELANVSPPIGSKLRKVYGAIQTKRFDQDILDERGLAPDSPAYEIIANLLSAGVNIPLDRALAEVRAIAEALDSNNTAMQRMALALGWRTWDVNIKNESHELIKTEAKAKRKAAGIEKAKETRKRNAKLKKEILIKLSKENIKEYKRYLAMSTKDKNEYIKKEIKKLNK
jgi:hypothetical protein